MSVIKLVFKYIQRFIQANLLSCESPINFYELRHFPNNIMFLSRGIGLFLGFYNSGSPHFWTIKLYTVVDTCQLISLV